MYYLWFLLKIKALIMLVIKKIPCYNKNIERENKRNDS